MLTFFREVGKMGRCSDRQKMDAYVDIVAQELQRESGSLATDVAVRYVGLYA